MPGLQPGGPRKDFVIITIATLSLIICIILVILNFNLAKKLIFDREKISPFECGFEPKTSARSPLSLRFYLIAVVFLIFDVEITLILPIPIIAQFSLRNNIILVVLFFILILLIGLLHEWNQGALDWDF